MRDGTALADARQQLEQAVEQDEPGQFSRARHAFYRVLLRIGGNRELQRLFPAIGMHIIYAQYQTPALRGIRLEDYRSMIAAVEASDVGTAGAAADAHVAQVTAIIGDRLA